MINIDFVVNQILPQMEKTCRKLSIAHMKHILHPNDEELLDELLQYQNQDGGFGNKLEPDIFLPNSSVAATNIAIDILNDMRQSDKKEAVIKDIIRFFEGAIDPKTKTFPIVPKEVDDYPHAIWWNSDSLSSFGYGNPNPEVFGFLFQHKKYLKTININTLINQMVHYINTDFLQEPSMHQILSVTRFYKRVDKDVKNLIHDSLKAIIDKEMRKYDGTSNEYQLEPYHLYYIEPNLLLNHHVVLEQSIEKLKNKLLNEIVIYPNWIWHQYDQEFKEARILWSGHMTVEAVRVVLQYKQ